MIYVKFVGTPIDLSVKRIPDHEEPYFDYGRYTEG